MPRNDLIEPLHLQPPDDSDDTNGNENATAVTVAEPWQPFPFEILPKALRDLIAEGAAAMDCDPSMIALPAIASCAGALGTVRAIQLKRGWPEYPILWPAIVAPSGTLKSPSMDYALRPLRKAQALRFREHKAVTEAFERDYQRYEADLNQWKRANSEKRGTQPEKPQAPACVRYVVSDATVEALAPILEANPRGVLAARDELGGWLGAFDQYKGKGKGGAGSDVANWLELHRAGPVTVDRKTGVRLIHIPRAAVSVCGTIQPGTLRRALTPEFFECGLAARLLLAAPPERKKRWTDREVPVRVLDRFTEVVEALLSLDHAPGMDGEPEPVNLKLSPEARVVWIEWYGECAEMLAAASEDRMKAALSKIEGGAARLALICQLVDDPASMSVGAEAMRIGVALAKWFAYEAERIYAMWSETPQQQQTRGLLEFIQSRGGSVTVRDLQRGPRQFRVSADEARGQLGALVVAGLGNWERPAPGAKGGHPSEVFRLNSNDRGDTTSSSGVLSEVPSLSPVSPSCEDIECLEDREALEL